MIGKRIFTALVLLLVAATSVFATESGVKKKRIPASNAAQQIDNDNYLHKAGKSCTYQGGPKSNLWSCR